MAATGDTGSRPILPHTSQSFTFAPQGPNGRDMQQRNFVFVDEHNRHKRLKVMRACEGCRRRKIKCDSATTNTWPCASCVRLKLTCVPPALNYDQDPSLLAGQAYEVDHIDDYPTIPIGNISNYNHQTMMNPMAHYPVAPRTHLMQASLGYADNMTMYQHPYIQTASTTESLGFGSVPSSAPQNHSLLSHDESYMNPNIAQGSISQERPWSPTGNVASASLADGLSDAMGDLKISVNGSSPYITDKLKLAKTPAYEDIEVQLPADSGPDARIRIPPEMMPSDDVAQRYLDYFFENIHPYVPVLNRTSFMQQWKSARDSISPLILEGIFACSTMTLNEHENGHKWLALSSKHEENFRDSPRLSTVQALLILLKAREAAPRRGYFYRSWMTLVNTIAMAKDLELHEHLDIHESGQACGVSIYECVCKTRCWQLCYVLEAMIGGPQGRFDLAVDTETVDFGIPKPSAGIDDREYCISRQLLYSVTMVKNVRDTMSLYARLRRKDPNWYANPIYIQHDNDFQGWLDSLPKDLQITFPLDGSKPSIPNSYVANLHCYFYLSQIMHHRPKIRFMEETCDWEQMKHELLLCHDAAKKMCRIQESILQKYGLPAFVWMQRGISFTVYCVLSCTMLHLVSITSPDPRLHGEGRDFFVRHMRILETIAPSWPLPEARAQVESLREAFSADTSKPFDLKPNFPYGSPAYQESPSPMADALYRPALSMTASSQSAVPQLQATIGQQTFGMVLPLTPPHSTHDESLQADSFSGQSMNVIAGTSGGDQHALTGLTQPQQQQWNPSKIFEQWNVAFGNPVPAPSLQAQPSPSSIPDVNGQLYSPTSVGLQQHLQQQAVASAAGNSYIPSSATMTPSPRMAYMVNPNITPDATIQTTMAAATTNGSNVYAGVGASNYVTPSMWQDVVANSFGGGMKRGWDYSQGNHDMVKRQR